jgi:DNA mismatch endonuclease (patch repair protein)
VADKLLPDRRSENMRAIKSKDTLPEVAVRCLAHAMGYRFRLHRKDLPGKPDLVFPRKRKVIFVHGCFWHQHPDPLCPDSRAPKTRLEYWLPKLQRNSQRDADHTQALQSNGWNVLVIWECETRDKRHLASRLEAFLA